MGEKGALVNWRRVFMLLYKRNKNIMFLDNPPSFDGAVEWILADFIDQFSRFPKNAFVSGSTEEAENIFYVFLFGELKRFEKDFGRYVERQVAENPKYENEACLFANRLCEGSDFVVESFNYTAPNLHCVSFRNVHELLSRDEAGKLQGDAFSALNISAPGFALSPSVSAISYMMKTFYNVQNANSSYGLDILRDLWMNLYGIETMNSYVPSLIMVILLNRSRYLNLTNLCFGQR